MWEAKKRRELSLEHRGYGRRRRGATGRWCIGHVHGGYRIRIHCHGRTLKFERCGKGFRRTHDVVVPRRMLTRIPSCNYRTVCANSSYSNACTRAAHLSQKRLTEQYRINSTRKYAAGVLGLFEAAPLILLTETPLGFVTTRVSSSHAYLNRGRRVHNERVHRELFPAAVLLSVSEGRLPTGLHTTRRRHHPGASRGLPQRRRNLRWREHELFISS